MVFIKKVRNTLLYLVLWRLLSVFVVQTSHVPDEYWQSLEVAHRLAFGYGYLTWEWRTGVRSCIYPFLISLLYRILAVCRLDYVVVLTTLPRVLQALLSGYADYRFYVWTRNKWALFSLCTNWYWYYCATRTLLNSVETSLTTIAISIFPWRDSHFRNTNFLWIVAFLCAMRPTAAVVWAPLCLYHFRTTSKFKPALALEYAMIGVTTLLLSTLVDTICYGYFVVSPWEFLRANVIQKVGDFYGKEHAFWYLTSGLPVILGLHCLTFLLAAWQVINRSIHLHRQAMMLIVIGWTVAIYSAISHKEFRFILPLLPMFIHLSTCGIFQLNYKATQFKRKMFMAILIVSNLLPGIYFSVIHQRGSLDVMKVLQKEVIDIGAKDTDILFLTPCHATPLYSHLHVNVTTRFLTCEPNVKHFHHYMDEAEMFFAHPILWLSHKYIHNKDVLMPSHLVMFDTLVPRITEFLKDYKPYAKVFYAHFPPSNYGEYLIVYKRRNENL